MTGKIFKTIFCVLNIGAMQLAVLGCLRKRDCSTQTTGLKKQKCCYSVQPPRCMTRFSCYLARTAKTTKAPFTPDFTVPDFTLPDYNIRDIHIDPPNNDNYVNYDNDYNSSDSTSSSPGATIGSLVAVILLSIFIFWFRHLRQKDVCFERPPVELTTNATSRTNLVTQESERPSLVTIAVRRDEGESVSENVPPEGEPPFLSEDDILQNLQSPSDPESLSLDPPKYEELPLLPYDTAQVPNPSLNTIPIQPNVDLPAVNPPSYEESQALMSHRSDR